MNKYLKQVVCIVAILITCLIFSWENVSAQDYTLDEFDLKVKNWAESCNQEIIALFENLLSSDTLSMVQLFDTFYVPIPGTEPPKYSTQYDKVLEMPLQIIFDNYLKKDLRLVYVMAVDAYGYLPAYNSIFDSSLTGNREEDIKYNKVKRILNNRIGLAASRNKKSYLVQSYFLDTGEEIMDFSMPIFIRDAHWGAVRIGYKKK